MATSKEIAAATATTETVIRERPKHGMQYDSQVVWVLDPGDNETRRNGDRLHGKRCAIDEKDRSAIISGGAATWPANLPKTRNSRVYIVGHGVPIGDAKGQVIGFKISAENGLNLDAAVLATRIRGLLDGTKVKRIALVMCYGGGWKAKSIGPERSFAFELAQYCGDLADDITARVDETFVRGMTLPRSNTEDVAKLSAALAPHMRRLHAMQNAAGNEVSVLGAAKTVAGFNVHEKGSVIIVRPNEADPKKPGFEYRNQWLSE